eukprot:jgi/Hompol1/2557/HPOL_005722-RA
MAASILSGRQEEELRLAILDYLATSGLQASFDTFRQEAAIDPASYVADGKQKYSGLLEKKWSSVIRLQKKIIELEAQMSQMQQELDAMPTRRRQGSGAGAMIMPRTPEKFKLSAHRGPITKIAFHPIYSIVATASEDATVKIWDAETGIFERTVKGHTKAVHDVAFHPNGSLMVTCSADLSIKVWDVESEYSCVRTLHGHDHSLSAIAFSPNGDFFLTASRDKMIRLWETATGFAIKTIDGHDEWVRDVAWSEDGQLAASAANDQTIIIWDPSSWTPIMHLTGHTHVIESISFAPLALVPAITKLAALSGFKPQLGPSGSAPLFIASASRDKDVKLWDAFSGTCLHTFSAHENWVRDLSFFPQSPYLVSVSDDKTLKVWDISTGKLAKSFEAHAHFTTCCAVHQSQAMVATGSVDQTSKLWMCI